MLDDKDTRVTWSLQCLRQGQNEFRKVKYFEVQWQYKINRRICLNSLFKLMWKRLQEENNAYVVSCLQKQGGADLFGLALELVPVAV